MKILYKLVPWTGSKPSWFGRLICKLAKHPPGPIYRGYLGEGADMRCRACGETIDH